MGGGHVSVRDGWGVLDAPTDVREPPPTSRTSFGRLLGFIVFRGVVILYLALIVFWTIAPEAGLLSGLSPNEYFFLEFASGPTSAAMFVPREKQRGGVDWTGQLLLTSVCFLGGVAGFVFVRREGIRASALGVAAVVWLYNGVGLVLYFFSPCADLLRDVEYVGHPNKTRLRESTTTMPAKTATDAEGSFGALACTVFGAACFLLCAACGPTSHDIEREVARVCPACEVEEWWVGEGDGSHAYVHLELSCRGQPLGEVKDWQFRSESGRWVATGVGGRAPRLFSKCAGPRKEGR